MSEEVKIITKEQLRKLLKKSYDEWLSNSEKLSSNDLLKRIEANVFEGE